jgi:hypothetical protein
MFIRTAKRPLKLVDVAGMPRRNMHAITTIMLAHRARTSSLTTMPMSPLPIISQTGRLRTTKIA